MNGISALIKVLRACSSLLTTIWGKSLWRSWQSTTQKEFSPECKYTNTLISDLKIFRNKISAVYKPFSVWYCRGRKSFPQPFRGPWLGLRIKLTKRFVGEKLTLFNMKFI